MKCKNCGYKYNKEGAYRCSLCCFDPCKKYEATFQNVPVQNFPQYTSSAVASYEKEQLDWQRELLDISEELDIEPFRITYQYRDPIPSEFPIQPSFLSKAQEDLEWMKKKVYESLAVPKEYLGHENNKCTGCGKHVDNSRKLKAVKCKKCTWDIFGNPGYDKGDFTEMKSMENARVLILTAEQWGSYRYLPLWNVDLVLVEHEGSTEIVKNRYGPTTSQKIGQERKIKPDYDEETMIEKLQAIFDDETPHKVVPVVCECGGDKSNTPHSDWCPKYDF